MITMKEKAKKDFIEKFINWYVFEQYPEYTPDEKDIVEWLEKNIINE